MHFDSPNRPPPLRPLLATAAPHPRQVCAASSLRYFVVLNKTTVDTPIGKADASQPVVIFASTAAAEANASARCRAAIAPRLAPRADRRGAPFFPRTSRPRPTAAARHAGGMAGSDGGARRRAPGPWAALDGPGSGAGGGGRVARARPSARSPSERRTAARARRARAGRYRTVTVY